MGFVSPYIHITRCHAWVKAEILQFVKFKVTPQAFSIRGDLKCRKMLDIYCRKMFDNICCHKLCDNICCHKLFDNLLSQTVWQHLLSQTVRQLAVAMYSTTFSVANSSTTFVGCHPALPQQQLRRLSSNQSIWASREERISPGLYLWGESRLTHATDTRHYTTVKFCNRACQPIGHYWYYSPSALSSQCSSFDN